MHTFQLRRSFQWLLFLGVLSVNIFVTTAVICDAAVSEAGTAQETAA